MERTSPTRDEEREERYQGEKEGREKRHQIKESTKRVSVIVGRGGKSEIKKGSSVSSVRGDVRVNDKTPAACSYCSLQ